MSDVFTLPVSISTLGTYTAQVNECRTVDGQASKQFVSKLAYVPMDMDNHSWKLPLDSVPEGAESPNLWGLTSQNFEPTTKSQRFQSHFNNSMFGVHSEINSSESLRIFAQWNSVKAGNVLSHMVTAGVLQQLL